MNRKAENEAHADAPHVPAQDPAASAGIPAIERVPGVPTTWLTRSGWLVAASLFITTVLWIAARRGDLANASFWPWRGPSQIVMLWSATLAMLSMLSVVRAQALESVFGGLDAGVRLHRRLGLTALLLMAAHGALLAADALAQGQSVAAVLVPFWVMSARTIDILVFYALMGLGILAYDRRMRHERWLTLHRVIGVLFVAGTLHAAMEPGTIQASEPLRTWIVILVLVGAAAWIYRVLLFLKLGPHYRYRVDCVVPRGAHTVDLVLQPLERRMMYEPGTFVFLRVPSFKGMERELHPFSISSSPLDRNLRVSVRQIGDFTQRISYLSLGEDNPDYWKARRPGPFHPVSALRAEDVDVYGPLGGFTPHRFQQYRRLVWIGAGIGITPFLAMLAFERSALDRRRIWLYYMVRSRDEAVYDEEIREARSRTGFYIEYKLWVTGELGRLTAAQVTADVARGDYAVMLCGSMPFVADLRHQFRALGVPTQRIIAEELQFRHAPPPKPAPTGPHS
jgi:predicted ferric reductase